MGKLYWENYIGKIILGKLYWENYIGKIILAKLYWENCIGKIILEKLYWKNYIGEKEHQDLFQTPPPTNQFLVSFAGRSINFIFNLSQRKNVNNRCSKTQKKYYYIQDIVKDILEFLRINQSFSYKKYSLFYFTNLYMNFTNLNHI